MFRRSPLLNYITYKGRLGRKQFFFYHVVLIVFILFMLDISLTIDRSSLIPALTIFAPLTTVVSLLFTMRRFHDMNCPGWFGLILYAMNFIVGHFGAAYPFLIWTIGLASTITILILFSKKGTSGPNPYGPDPTVKLNKKNDKKAARKDMSPLNSKTNETTDTDLEKHK